MHRKFKSFFSLFLMILMPVLFSSGQIQAATFPGYSISQYESLVQLQQDGSADITETISYQVDRNLKSFAYVIDYADAGSIQLKQISVSSDLGDTSSPVFVDVQPAEASSSQLLPMTYEVKDNGEKLQIKLQVFSEKESTRTVRLVYHLAQLVTIQKDAALLKSSFFTTSGQSVIENPSLGIVLPTTVSPLQVWNLPSSLADFKQNLTAEGNRLDFQAGRLASGQNLSLVCLLPMDIFPDARLASNGKTWDELAAAAREADMALHQADEVYNSVVTLIFVLLGLSIVLGLMIYWFFDRESAARFRERYWQEIPENCPPAIMAILLRKARPGKLILATLVDLVRRGELQMHGCVFSLPERKVRDYTGYSAYEAYLIEWLFGRMTADQTISTAEIRRQASDPIGARQFQAYYHAFRDLVDEEMTNRALVDQTLSQRGRLICLLTALVYLFLTALGIIYLQSAFSLLLLIPVAGLTLYSFLIRRLTVNGRELYAKGQALNRTLRRLARLKLPLDPDFIRDAIPMAIGFGSADPLLDQLLQLKPDEQLLLKSSFDRYYMPAASLTWTEQVKSLAADLKVMESMLSASLLLSSGIHR